MNNTRKSTTRKHCINDLGPCQPFFVNHYINITRLSSRMTKKNCSYCFVESGRSFLFTAITYFQICGGNIEYNYPLIKWNCCVIQRIQPKVDVEEFNFIPVKCKEQCMNIGVFYCLKKAWFRWVASTGRSLFSHHFMWAMSGVPVVNHNY